MNKRIPLKDFKQRSKNRQKMISRNIILPNLLDEFTKSKLIIVVFFALVYFTYRDWLHSKQEFLNIPKNQIPFKEHLPANNFLADLVAYIHYRDYLDETKREIDEYYESHNITDDDGHILTSDSPGIKDHQHDLTNIDSISETQSRILETRLISINTEKDQSREKATQAKEVSAVIFEVFPGLKRLYDSSLAKFQERKRSRKEETPMSLENKRRLDSDNEELYDLQYLEGYLSILVKFLHHSVNKGFVTFIIVMVFVSLILISFGNSPQYECHWTMFFAFFLIIINLLVVSFMFFIGIRENNIMIMSCLFCLVALLAIFSRNRFSPTSLLFSSFHEDRDYIYSEYTYQKLFGQVSVYWGMRFGLYPSFRRYFKVEISFAPPKFYERDGKKVTSKNGQEIQVEVDALPETIERRDPTHLEQAKLRNQTFSDFNINGLSQPNIQTNNNHREDEVGLNWFDIYKDHQKIYEKIYAFYDINEMEHSFIIKKKDRLTVSKGHGDLHKRKLKNKLWKLIRPFKSYKKHLMIKNPLYLPSRLLIALLIQFVIQIQFLNFLRKTFHSFRTNNSEYIKFVNQFLKFPDKDIYRASSISLILIILLYIGLSFISTTEFLLNFEATLVRFRLKGLDELTKKTSNWGAIDFIKHFIGSIFFSNGPVAIIFFFFFTFLFSSSCWMFVWKFRMFWLPIVSIVILEKLLDMAARKITGDRRYFKLRKCIQFIDCIKLFVCFYTGFFYGMTRFVVGILFVNITMLRIDKSGVPNWVSKIKNMDIANRTYIGMVKMYHCSNNPIVFAFVGIVADHIYKLRSGTKKELWIRRQKTKMTETPKDRNKDNRQTQRQLARNRLRKMTDQQKKSFLKMAYKWQMAVYLIRNPLLVKYKHS